MTRQEIMEAYEIRDGVIASPGKFEGEAIYVPAFNDFVMDGGGDEILDWADESRTDIIHVDDELRQEWPEISSDCVAIAIEESDTGFVYASELTQARLDELMAEYEADQPAEDEESEEADEE